MIPRDGSIHLKGQVVIVALLEFAQILGVRVCESAAEYDFVVVVLDLNHETEIPRGGTHTINL